MKKVKRCSVDWLIVLNSEINRTQNVLMREYFFHLLSKLHKGKHLSTNRCAYATLKHFYSTTTIVELFEKINELH